MTLKEFHDYCRRNGLSWRIEYAEASDNFDIEAWREATKPLIFWRRKKVTFDGIDENFGRLVEQIECKHLLRSRHRVGSWCPDCGAVFFGEFLSADE